VFVYTVRLITLGLLHKAVIFPKIPLIFSWLERSVFMVEHSNAKAKAVKDLRAERDRFVALAFCWADILIEIDGAGNIVFTGGVLDLIVGKNAKEMIGQSIYNIIDASDVDYFKQLLKIAGESGRIDNVAIRLKGKAGATSPLPLVGYKLADLGNHVFIAMQLGPGVAGRSSQGSHNEDHLLDTASFAEMAKEALAENENNQMTLIDLPGLSTLEDRLDKVGQKNLNTTISSYLRANSANADGAAKLEEGKFGLVHDKNLDVDALNQQLAEITKVLDPTGQGSEVASATIDPKETGISEEDLGRALVFAINNFQQSTDGVVTLEALSNNLNTLVDEARESAEMFQRAVQSQDFRLVFQPIVDLQSGDIHHYEALARFQGKHGSSPYKYITFAEQTGMISAFDIEVAKKAIYWLENEDHAKSSIAVNVSGQSVTNLSYINELMDILVKKPWLKNRLIFEITESARVEDLDEANSFIQNLRRKGFEVCLDDFGAGAASFQYLSTMEVDVVKLDGVAVRNAEAAAKGKAFMKALANLCRDLKVHTIAEMIDNPRSLEFCRDCGVDYVQGYLFGKPEETVYQHKSALAAKYGQIMSDYSKRSYALP
jgi:EAL domain-containing protein (putative c-di-GMP-specific phosphodiesterase class I)